MLTPADEMRKALMQILTSIDGLYAIILSDRDGVAIIKVVLESTPELASRMNFLSTFGNATDQAGKLGMGKNTKIISMYKKLQVIQISKIPIVITLIASISANTGYLLTLEKTLDPLVNALKGNVHAE
ncbi:ragulator complex protein LAMTOR3-A [Folsomia candida]|uniref:ragulator complex protein LAMTOR3-A n=1 Tax=Folsomia candida TaxID=158441 RepID=UPI000B8FA6F6|nr:ragulator complex protein LAMTOR3-A [Folsomia candida]